MDLLFFSDFSAFLRIFVTCFLCGGAAASVSGTSVTGGRVGESGAAEPAITRVLALGSVLGAIAFLAVAAGFLGPVAAFFGVAAVVLGPPDAVAGLAAGFLRATGLAGAGCAVGADAGASAGVVGGTGLSLGVVIAKTPVALLLVCRYWRGIMPVPVAGWRQNPAGRLRSPARVWHAGKTPICAPTVPPYLPDGQVHRHDRD